MCDEDTLQDSKKFMDKRGSLTRRQFGTLSAGAAMAMMLPPLANALDVTETDVTVKSPDGDADCYFVHPASGRHPAVLIWPDAFGLRPAMRMMGKRLAQSGYAVLVVNPYYREQQAPVVSSTDFQDESVRNIVVPLMRSLTPEIQEADAHSFITYLDQQDAVDTTRKAATTGYCMGGPIVMRTAAALPERIGAAASFHGGGLVTETEDSPHLLIPSMQASFLIAIAENDDAKEPATKKVLREAFDQAGLPAEIEVYDGAMHGWCPPDSTVYDEALAERAWGRMLVLFETALG